MDYSLSFNTRASKYVSAIKKYPNALEEEFSTALKMLKLKKNDVLLNLPCGGVYIQPPSNVKYHKLEINSMFAEIDNVEQCTLSNIPFEDESVDKILTLACLHHSSEEERKDFYNECIRILKHNGILVMADVVAKSKQSIWLNEIVNKYNGNILY